MEGYLLDVARIIVAAAILLPAALQDWRERKASNRYWMAGGAIGFLLIEVELFGSSAPFLHHLFILSVAWIFFDVFWTGDEIFGEGGLNIKGPNGLRLALYLISLVIFVGSFLLYWGDLRFSILLSVLLMLCLIYILYMFDVIKGGADAKALMTLSILFPRYPAISSLLPSIPLISSLTAGSFSGQLTWEQVFFPFSFVIFMTAAVVSLFIPLALFFKNLLKGELEMPQAFFGYKIPLDEVKKRHVWLMERVVDGEIRVSLFPRDDVSKQLALLEGMGRKEVWVNPKVPFLIPITVGFFLTLMLGNILLLFV